MDEPGARRRANPIERIERVFDNFGELKIHNDNFYREQARSRWPPCRWSCLLPAAYLLVFFVAQVRWDTRLIILLAQVSAYLILATIFRGGSGK